MMTVMMTPLCLLLLPLLVTLFFHVLLVNASKEEDSFAASKFKAPNNSTLPSVKQEWSQQDEALWKYIESHVPAVLEHTGASAFDEHLKGVQAVLTVLECTQTCNICRLVSQSLRNTGISRILVLATHGTTGDSRNDWNKSRTTVLDLLHGGSIFGGRNCLCVEPKKTCENQTGRLHFTSRPELGRFKIPLESKEEWLDFLELTLADWLEQVEGAAETF